MYISWILILTLIVISTTFYTVARYRNSLTFLRIIQPITTLLFVILASVGTFIYGIHHFYTMLIMLALTFALAGDCNLIELKNNRKFLISVFFYWLGIISYSIMFTYYTGFTWHTIVLFFILVSATAFTIKKFFWKGMKETNLALPIIIYCLTWCYLLSHTLTIFFSNNTLLTPMQKLLILLGTGLYFLGDLDLSFHKFNNKFKKKPYWLGALLYCIGQTLVALSASLFSITL